MAEFQLESLNDARTFARFLAETQSEFGYLDLFLIGPLGSGKTALVSFLVSNYVNAQYAEVASPSFNICNYYRTTPLVMHCDLYRCRSMLPDEILEFHEAREGQLIIEWAEFFPYSIAQRLDIYIDVVNDTRYLKIHGYGAAGRRVESSLAALWREQTGRYGLKQ